MAQYPKNQYFNFNTNDSLWLRIRPLKVSFQNSADARRSGINAEWNGDEFLFLVPSSFLEETQHTWSNHQSLGTRAVEKAADISRQAKEIANNANSLANGVVGGNIVRIKMDTPLTFEDSNRRFLNITVQLQDQGNTELDVFEPVRQLQIMSCADKGEGRFGFNLPYIFTVETLGSKLIYIKYAALESVQPTYMGPYRGGYPSKCDLSLNFKDIEPLYKTSYKKPYTG